MLQACTADPSRLKHISQHSPHSFVSIYSPRMRIHPEVNENFFVMASEDKDHLATSGDNTKRASPKKRTAKEAEDDKEEDENEGAISMASKKVKTSSNEATANTNSPSSSSVLLSEDEKEEGQENDKDGTCSTSTSVAGDGVEVEFSTDRDVLSGRGGGTNLHPGNRCYRDLILSHRKEYDLASKAQKPSVSRQIVHLIRQNGGRFLRKDSKDGKYYEIGDDLAREKTSQALRHRTFEMRTELGLQKKDAAQKQEIAAATAAAAAHAAARLQQHRNHERAVSAGSRESTQERAAAPMSVFSQNVRAFDSAALLAARGGVGLLSHSPFLPAMGQASAAGATLMGGGGAMLGGFAHDSHHLIPPYHGSASVLPPHLGGGDMNSAAALEMIHHHRSQMSTSTSSAINPMMLQGMFASQSERAAFLRPSPPSMLLVGRGGMSPPAGTAAQLLQLRADRMQEQAIEMELMALDRERRELMDLRLVVRQESERQRQQQVQQLQQQQQQQHPYEEQKTSSRTSGVSSSSSALADRVGSLYSSTITDPFHQLAYARNTFPSVAATSPLGQGGAALQQDILFQARMALLRQQGQRQQDQQYHQ
jgi:hypothetical protein